MLLPPSIVVTGGLRWEWSHTASQSLLFLRLGLDLEPTLGLADLEPTLALLRLNRMRYSGPPQVLTRVAADASEQEASGAAEGAEQGAAEEYRASAREVRSSGGGRFV